MKDVFDTHFHLYPDDDLSGLLARAAQQRVSRLLVAGAAPENLGWMVEATADHPGLYGAVGLHPHNASAFDGEIEPYREWLLQPHICAVGEIGLDYFYDRAPQEQQHASFEAFLQLARETNQPCVVHCREADEDCFAMLRDILDGGRFVVHCFTSTREWAYRYLDIGGYLSFTGILTFKRSDALRELVSSLPGDRIFFETDSPFLAPVPHRGKRNEPALVPLVVSCAAAARGEDPVALNDQATENAIRFFGLDSAAPVNVDASADAPIVTN